MRSEGYGSLSDGASVRPETRQPRTQRSKIVAPSSARGCNSLCACSKNQAVAVSIRRRRFSENATCAEKSCGVQGWQIMCVLCEGKFVTRSTIKK